MTPATAAATAAATMTQPAVAATATATTTTTTTPGYNPYTVSYPRKQDTCSSNHNGHHHRHNLKSLPASAHDYFTSHFKEPCQRQYPYESCCYTPSHHDNQRVNTNNNDSNSSNNNNNNNNNPLFEKCHLVDNHVDSAHDQEEALESVWNDFLLEDAASNHHHHHSTLHDGLTIKEVPKGRTKHNSSMTSPSISFSSMLMESSCLTDDNLHCTNSSTMEEQKMSKVSSLQSLVSKLEQQDANDDDMGILSSFSIEITSLSMKPLSACDILERVEERSQEVVTKYLPCVEFLVLCQQELRIGLDVATRSRGGRMGGGGVGGGGYAMSTGQVCLEYAHVMYCGEKCFVCISTFCFHSYSHTVSKNHILVLQCLLYESTQPILYEKQNHHAFKRTQGCLSRT
jgi:hypothetical protein